MKLAIIQFAPVLGDRLATQKRLEALFQKAGTADMVVLPELANSGYNFTDRDQALQLGESIQNSSFLDFLQQQCAKYDFKLCTGFCERENDWLYNSSVLLDANGLIGSYRKLHLFMREKEIFEPGNQGLPVFEVDGVRLGMLVCFDWMFPEVWRKLALKGVDVILHPSNLVLPYAQGVMPSYSLVNRIFIATANRIGKEGELNFTGKSQVTGPDGKVLGQAEAGEEVLLVDLDPFQARDKMITPMNHAFEDRRSDVYKL